MKWTLAYVTTMVVAAAACGADDPSGTPPPPAGDDTGTGGALVSDVGSGGMGEGEGGGPEPATCADAIPLTLDVFNQFTDGEATLTDGHAFYRLTLGGDRWYALFTEPSEVDTVIQLRTVDGELLASNDDQYPRRAGTASVLIYRTDPNPADYCVELLDFEGWLGGPGIKGESSPFAFAAFTVDNEEELAIPETEPNDTLAQAVEHPRDGRERYILGGHGTPDDVDYYRIAIPEALRGSTLGINIAPMGTGSSGVSGFGSDPESTISVLDADGQTVLSRIQQADLSAACGSHSTCEIEVTVPVDSNAVFLRFEGPASPSYRSHYIAYPESYTFLGLDEPAGDDMNDVNDTAATAIDIGTGAFRGTLPDGDVDWYVVGDADDARSLEFLCNGRTLGSGLNGLTVEVFTLASGGQGAPASVLVESPSEAIEWGLNQAAREPPLPGRARYLVRVTAAEAAEPDVMSQAYTCFAFSSDELK